MPRPTAIPLHPHWAPAPPGAWRRVLAALFLMSPLAGSAQAVRPWNPVRNTAPQKTTSRVDESRPIYYPRLAHVEAGDQGAADRLLHELLDLHTAMSYREAAQLADHLVQMMPHRPQAHYNRACVMGRLRRSEEALSSLERAVDCGWRDLVHLSVDPDLDSIRDTARYAGLAQRLRQLIAAEAQAPPAAGPQAPRGPADSLHCEAAAILQGVAVQAATIALVDGGRVSWMASITTDGGRQEPGRDEPIEVSSLARLFALVAVLKQQPHDVSALADPGLGRGAVLRQAGHQQEGPRAASEAELIEAAETATSLPFASYCRTQILGPLRMTRTHFVGPTGTSSPVVHSTAGDLGRLLAALCTPTAPGAPQLLDEASIERLLAAGERFGLAAHVEPGAQTAGLELVHRSADGAALLRWYPRRGRGLVVVTRGGDGIPAARRIAGLVLGQ
ncbi:MAG: TPR end-of-group domain-containing protein [Planctomycetota bacterium]